MQFTEQDTDTVREVLDDWLAAVDDMPIDQTSRFDALIESARNLRYRIAEQTGELYVR